MTPRPEEVAAFRVVVATRLGLAFDETQVGTLADVLDRHARARGMSPAAYVKHLQQPDAAKHLPALARDLTVGESYFFRDADQLRAFREVVLAELARTGRRLRILSAGCASGEEPYTLAITMRERLGIDASVLGIDVNPAALEKAARMRYSQWSLRDVPSHVRDEWFRRDGDAYALRADVGQTVRFEERNLADPATHCLEREAFDVVFCRNVLMYFTPEAAKRLVAGIARSLVPGGYLFLGHAENLRGLSQDFHLCHTQGTFYYQRRIGEPEPAASSDVSWVDIIREATQRVRSITDVRRPSPENPEAQSSSTVGAALDLLRRERFTEAFARLHELPPSADSDPDALLLKAVLQTHTGDLAGAERTCHDLLGHDDMSAGAHYLLALCREAAGDIPTAAEHDRVASYLDPSFAMPVLHLGLLAKRGGDSELARVALGRGLVLLEREDAPRILLFGGGFGREALMALCKSHLGADGGR